MMYSGSTTPFSEALNSGWWSSIRRSRLNQTT